jgi:hypothetical protein
MAIENLIKADWADYEEDFKETPNKYFVRAL